ncbi:MAG: sugar phosphate isomerase/epimerase [Clostridiales bacterium]|nr:sugar phosphate isomerase/epimerase [Clostridiales bacterium]
MKLSYQVATPDVRPAPGVTAYQGDLEHAFARLREEGYDGAELMVCDPGKVDAALLKQLCERYGLAIPMVCTGEVFGQDGLSFSDPDAGRREEALRRVQAAADLAAQFGAQINIGRVRGGYVFGMPQDICRERSVAGMRQAALYAQSVGVTVALEPVNSIASNFINTTQQGIHMVQEIGVPAFTLMLDSNHMFIDDLDITQSIHDAKDLVTYVHMVDSNRLYPGNCKLDFGAFITALKEIGYDGWLSVEVFQRPDQDTALRRSIRHLRACL